MPPNAQRGGSGGVHVSIPPPPRGVVRPLWHLIYTYSQQLRLDPYAVAAVSVSEGGGRFGAVGDHGSSYGPFQLHRGGALPAGLGPEFANSPRGVLYAMQHMAASGAAGLHGLAAIRAIVTRFERPAAPGPEVARSWGTYNGGADRGNYQFMPAGGGMGQGWQKLVAQQHASFVAQQQQMLTALTHQAAEARQQGLAQQAAQQLLQQHQAGAQAQMQLAGQPAAGLGDPAGGLVGQNRQRALDLRQRALQRAGIA